MCLPHSNYFFLLVECHPLVLSKSVSSTCSVLALAGWRWRGQTVLARPVLGRPQVWTEDKKLRGKNLGFEISGDLTLIIAHSHMQLTL